MIANKFNSAKRVLKVVLSAFSAYGTSAFSGFLLLSVTSCDQLHNDKPAARRTEILKPIDRSSSSIGSHPIKVTDLDVARLQNAFDAGKNAYQAAENQRILNPTMLEVLASSHPSAASASQDNWEKSIAVFKESMRDLKRSRPDSVAAAVRNLGRTFQPEEQQVNFLILNTVTFYDSRWRSGSPPTTEELKRDFSSLHTQLSPSQDPAVIRSDRMFE
jgi:hypothetical protein